MKIQLNKKNKTVSVNGKKESLTPKEYGILELFLNHPDSILTSEEIYESIWRATPYACHSIIAVHLRHIREKIEPNPSKPIYIRSLWKKGYIFQTNPEG